MSDADYRSLFLHLEGGGVLSTWDGWYAHEDELKRNWPELVETDRQLSIWKELHNHVIRSLEYRV